MICDAHVHIGYYPRKGYDRPFYYSPRRIAGILDRCGVGELIVSSTCAQMEEISIADIVREAREMKRLAGNRAHVFFWLSGHLYDEDSAMKWIETGLFEGVKLHEGETPWVKCRKKALRKIMSVASERNLPVMFHAGEDAGCRPSKLAKVAREFPKVRFNFAHCRPMGEMAKVVADCSNVWTDTAYMAIDEFPKLRDYDWHGRLMFGTDLPVWQAKERVGLTRRYREYVRAFRETGLEAASNTAFMSFVCAGGKRLMMDVGQNVKMNEDDEWISIDKIIRDINRDMKLADEVERCQELNAKLNLEPNKPKHKRKVKDMNKDTTKNSIPAKKTIPTKKPYHITYQIWGNYTDSNLCGTGTVEAESEEQAVAFFKEDWTTPGMLSDVCIDDVEEFEDADEDCEDEDRKCWNTSFSVTGKHGSYCGCGGPYATTEDEANSLQVKDLTAKDGLGDIESLEVEDWSVPPFAKSREA